MLDYSEIQARLCHVGEDSNLASETGFDARARALLELDSMRAQLEARARWEDVRDLQALITTLGDRLRAVDRRVISGLRDGIRDGTLRGSALRSRLDEFVTRPNGAMDLDLLVRGLLGLDDPPAAQRRPDAEMVALEPTPAHVVLGLVDLAELSAEDVFLDLGSGLGHVPLLVHLLTGAEALGIEVEPSYCEFSRRRADELGAAGVRYVNLDVRHADLRAGNVFYLFTPFRGRLMDQVMGLLEARAQAGPIAICTYGPCTPVVAQELWLDRIVTARPCPDSLAAFRSAG